MGPRSLGVGCEMPPEISYPSGVSRWGPGLSAWAGSSRQTSPILVVFQGGAYVVMGGLNVPGKSPILVVFPDVATVSRRALCVAS